MKDCDACKDRELCRVIDDADVQFWPPKDKISEISRRLGKRVTRRHVKRVESCLFTKRHAVVEGGEENGR